MRRVADLGNDAKIGAVVSGSIVDHLFRRAAAGPVARTQRRPAAAMAVRTAAGRGVRTVARRADAELDRPRRTPTSRSPLTGATTRHVSLAQCSETAKVHRVRRSARGGERVAFDNRPSSIRSANSLHAYAHGANTGIRKRITGASLGEKIRPPQKKKRHSRSEWGASPRRSAVRLGSARPTTWSR